MKSRIKPQGIFIAKPALILFNLSRIRTNKWKQIYSSRAILEEAVNIVWS